MSPELPPFKQGRQVRACNEVLDAVVLVAEDMFRERLHGSCFIQEEMVSSTSAHLIKETLSPCG